MKYSNTCNMDKIKKVLVFSACSILLGSLPTEAARKNTQTSGLSYGPSTTTLANQYRSNTEDDFSPLTNLATNMYSSASYSPAQPNIYHSVIDQTVNPASIASTAQTSTATIDGDLSTAAGHHHGHAHGKYYEYRAVPEKKTWKYGYKRGNHKHTIMRHEHGKAGKHPHFKTKVKWHDKKSKGKGIHLWDYNHHDKKHYGHYG